MHLLTALPFVFTPRAGTSATDRIRREGTRNLVAAAVGAGAQRLVAESIAFLYAPSGAGTKDEDSPHFLDAPAPFDGTVRAVLDLEQHVLRAPVASAVLRYGFLYGPGTWYAPDGSIAQEVRRRRYPIVGDGGGTFSFLHVDDAAAATGAAIDGGTDGVYNVVDDEPAPMREWLPVYARALDAPAPLRIPAWVAGLLAGRAATTLATRGVGADNAKARRELAWAPGYATWRTGFARSLRTTTESGGPE